MTYRTYVLQSATAAFLTVSATASGALTPDPETGLIPVRLPTDLCAFEGGLPSDLIRQVTPRSDFDDLLLHMVENCPALALDLADFATAAIAADAGDDDDNDDEEFVRRTGTTTVSDTAGENGGGTDGGTDGNGGGDGADNGDKNLPGWKIAKKNGLAWKWEKKVARWEQQREERDAWRAQKKASKHSDENDKDLPDWKIAKKAAKQNGSDEGSEGSEGNGLPDWKEAKKQARWEADRKAAEEAQAAKKESKFDPNDGSGDGSVSEDDQEVVAQAE